MCSLSFSGKETISFMPQLVQASRSLPTQDHYGNHISMFFKFDKNRKILYLKKLNVFFPFKQDTLGRNKYCIMDNLNMDIRTIDSEQLFDEFNPLAGHIRNPGALL